MKKLSFFIFRSFIGPFIITFGIAMFFLIMQFLWKYVDDLMGKGLELSILFELLFYVSAVLIPLALPLAVLFSSIMTFGNLAEKNELTALKSSGMSLFRVMRPMFFFMIILSLGAFYFTNYILPIANLKQRAIIFNIQEKKPTFALTEGVFYNEIDGYSIRCDRKNDNTGQLEGVLIYEDKLIGGKTIRAKKGEMLKSDEDRYLLLRLENGSMYESVGPSNVEKSRFPFQKSFFAEAVIKFDMSDFKMQEEDEDLFKRDYDMMNFIQLDYALDSLYVIQDSILEQFNKTIDSRILILDDHFFEDGKPLFPPSTSLEDPNRNNAEIHPVDTIIFLDSLHASELAQANAAAQANIRGSKDIAYSQVLYKQARDGSYINFKTSWHKKFTLSIAVIVLFFIGAPLGAIIKKGGLGAPLVFATLFFILYYVLTISGENMIETRTLSPVSGSWLSSIVLAPLGVWLTYKAANDSALFDREAYKRIFSKFRTK